jgi:hypothetical protein
MSDDDGIREIMAYDKVFQVPALEQDSSYRQTKANYHDWAGLA